MKYDHFAKGIKESRYVTFTQEDALKLLKIDPSDRKLTNSVRCQITNWCGSGRLIRLRKGIYTLPRWMQMEVPREIIALNVFPDGAISGLGALAYWGLVPRQVDGPTVVSPHAPARDTVIKTEYGIMRFQRIPEGHLWGCVQRRINGQWSYAIACPEKALLDQLWLMGQNVLPEHLDALRLQPSSKFNFNKFERYIEDYKSKRVSEAAKRVLSYLRPVEGSAVSIQEATDKSMGGV